MKIKIVTKRPNGSKLRGVGLGNQIWFIPAIRHLLKEHEVFTDSNLLSDLNICPISDENPDAAIIPLYPNWKDVLETKLSLWPAKIYGFKYRVKGHKVGMGYFKSVSVDDNISELNVIKSLIPSDEPFFLSGHNPESGRVILGTSNKDKCLYNHWYVLIRILTEMGYKVDIVGEYGKTYGTYQELFDVFCKAEFFIGVDSGLMHLADILNMPGFVFWGHTPFIKNRPINKLKVVRNLNLYPSKRLVKDCFVASQEQNIVSQEQNND